MQKRFPNLGHALLYSNKAILQFPGTSRFCSFLSFLTPFGHVQDAMITFSVVSTMFYICGLDTVWSDVMWLCWPFPLPCPIVKPIVLETFIKRFELCYCWIFHTFKGFFTCSNWISEEWWNSACTILAVEYIAINSGTSCTKSTFILLSSLHAYQYLELVIQKVVISPGSRLLSLRQEVLTCYTAGTNSSSIIAIV